ncbi:MAG: nuclear transport factor 2 family protein [Cyanobacteriota bacterium]|nr:nuclear transport factor 2 family protein [Cyanobacteriota bacterium]
MPTSYKSDLDRSLDSHDPIVRSYFDRLNSGNFRAVAQLFAERGTFRPPFEDAIVGCDAICTYLRSEADGVRAVPHQESGQQLPNGDRTVRVVGEVQTLLFSVNTSWKFTLNSSSEILDVTIELLASPQDLFNLQQFR